MDANLEGGAVLPAAEPYWNEKAQKLRDRNRLVEQYLPLVSHIAKLLWGRKIARRIGDFEDLVAAGYESLIRAAELYNPTHPTAASFKTYAYRSILRAVLRSADESGVIRVPASTLRAVRAPSEKSKPQTAEVCRSVNAALAIMPLPSDYDAFVDSELDKELWLEEIRQMTDLLPADIRNAVKSSFGIECDAKPMSKIGNESGVTGQAIRQRRKNGLKAMRKMLTRDGILEPKHDCS